MGFIRKQLLKVIEYKDESKDTLVYRFPMEDREIMNGSALTVRESQVAIFVHKGQIADIFEPGFYKLKTENLPVLTKILSWKYGFNSPFKAECYFVNTKQFTDQKWGTANPIMMRDSDFGMVRVRGFGKYSFRVEDPETFLKELFGTNSSFKTEDINEYLRSSIIQGISDSIAESKIAALDLAANYRELAGFVAKSVNGDFVKMGLSLTTVIIENLSLPQEVEKNMDTRTSMGVMGDKMGQFMQFQAAHAMRDAAQNPSGGLAGAGVGLGAGMGLGQMFSQTLAGMNQTQPGAGAQTPAKTEACPKCGAKVVPGTKFCPECGEKLAETKKCGKCGAECPADAKFCAECGFRFEEKTVCPKCGAKVVPGAKFCPECGEKL